MEKLTHAQLYQDLIASQVQEDVVPLDCFTAKQFGKDIGKKRARTSEILRGMVDAGELKVQLVLLNGHHTKVYWFPDTEEVDDDADNHGCLDSL